MSLIRQRSSERTSVVLALLLVACGVVYGTFQARALIYGPIIVLEQPHNGSTVQGPLMTVRGTAHNITHLTLNDRQIFTDPSGVFTERALVPEGYAVFIVSARDRFGRVREERIAFFGEPFASSTNTTERS